MLSAQAKVRLKNALTRSTLANEMDAAMAADAPLSDKLKRALVVALTSKAAADQVAVAVDAPLGTLSAATKARIRLAMASKKYGDELIALIES
jgi:hypothetical protein